jgi:hypothetical protein
MAVFSGLLFVANAVGLYFVAQQLSISKQTLEISERSHLFATPTSFYIASDENTPTVLFKLRNYSRNPAYSVRYGLACQLKAGRPQFVSPWLENVTPITPGEERDGLKAKCWNMPKEQVEVMGSGSQEFYVWTLVWYRDPIAIALSKEWHSFECWRKTARSAKSDFAACGPGSNDYGE